MSYLQSRINKIENKLDVKSLKRVFFWRDDPDVPGEYEKAFMENTPDLGNYQILVLTLGKANLR